MTEIKKADLDRSIRAEGEKLIDTSNLELIGGSYFGKTEIDGGRYFEVKVVAKSKDFDDDSLEGLREERRLVEERKAQTAALNERKRNKAAELKASKAKKA